MFLSTEHFKTLSDFVLMEYADAGSKKGISLVGKNTNEDLVVYPPGGSFGNDIGSAQIVKKTSPKNGSSNSRIVNIVSLSYDNDLSPRQRLVVRLKSEGESSGSKGKADTTKGPFLLEFYDNDNLLFTEESPALPLVVSNPATLAPLIGIPKGKEIKFYDVSKEGIHLNENFKIEAELSTFHTSSFIGLTNNLVPNLVLFSKKEGKTFVLIYNFVKGSQKLIQSFSIPDKVGPVLFAVTRDTPVYDMVYVSIENKKSFLNIHRNKLQVDKNTFTDMVEEAEKKMAKKTGEVDSSVGKMEIFEKDPVKLPLDKLVNSSAVLKDDQGMPCGLFMADLSMTGKKDFYITFDEPDGKTVRSFSLAGKDNAQNLVLSPYDEDVKTYKNVISISAADLRCAW